MKRSAVDNPLRINSTLAGDVISGGGGKHNYAPQNLFVQPSLSNVDEKNNLARAIYSTTNGFANGDQASESLPASAAPPRPPLPQDDGKFEFFDAVVACFRSVLCWCEICLN